MDAGLALPRLPADHRLRAIIRKRTGAAAERPSGHGHWPAARFGLERARLFRGADPAAQAAILDGCGRALLDEAFMIEKVGVAYAAKMILLARTSDERQLYGLFAADEAIHMERVRAFLDAEPTGENDPFLSLLAGLIGEGDRTSLQLVVQVALEGWGLVHYAGLAADCRCAALQTALQAILADESAHHGSGLVLAGEAEALDEPFVEEVLARFLAMVAAGPQGVVAEVERVLGHLSRPQRVGLFEELAGEAQADERLQLLRRLLGRVPAARAVVERLEAAAAFTPVPARRCA